MTTTISGSNGIVFPDATSMQTGQQAVKAWVNFDGSGTVAIRAGYNVSSISDNGTGDYSVNFTTAMVDANYAIAGIASNNNGQSGTRELGIDTDNPPTVGNATVITGAAAGAKEDVPYVFVTIFSN